MPLGQCWPFAPVAAPTAVAWSGITRETDEYRRTVIHRQFLHERETLVWALTELGNGYWVLTPLLTAAGETVLINRGYVPATAAKPAQRMAGLIDGEVSVTGLLRISEPEGIPLRDNDPAAERWYSRDVGAIARVRKLTNAAPYFIDADDTTNPGGLPIGDLTRLDYRNVHLVYTLTWYGPVARRADLARDLARAQGAGTGRLIRILNAVVLHWLNVNSLLPAQQWQPN